jgi:ubiquinone/menaquinone biosynthesis C-methylase UbiE
MKQLIREIVSRKNAYRVPEPDLVMESPAQVASFHEAGGEEGVMAPVYLFHAAHVCEIVKPGDRVLDLGCGPGNQLGLIARLNPDVQFIGIDLSAEMLVLAEKNLAVRGARNVELRRGDITCLEGIAGTSIDAVISTVVLHHLPDEAALFRCFAEVARVLKPNGGLYLVDFGHLKTEAAIRGFAYQHANRQPELFTLDYLNSLRAAFEVESWREGWQRYLSHAGEFFSTALVPYMVSLKSPPRRSLPMELRAELARQRRALPPHHRADIKDLITFFRLGGMVSPAY